MLSSDSTALIKKSRIPLAVFIVFLFSSFSHGQQLIFKLNKAQRKNLTINQHNRRFKEVSVQSAKVDSLFRTLQIREFRQAFPAVKHFDHPIADKLLGYYTMVTEEDSSTLVAIEGSDLLENISIVYNGEVLYSPNDYSETYDRHNWPLEHDVHLDQINAKQAWDISKGDNVIISIHEPNGSGFRPEHPELIDKVLSTNGSKSEQHGTWVAGCAAAETDNDIGVASIGFNAKMILNVGSSYDNFNWMLTNLLEGARIFNFSYISAPCGSDGYDYQQDIINLITAYGGIVVAAAGNGTRGANCNIDGYIYPASYDNVISVSSVDPDDSYFHYINSNPYRHTYNDKVDMTAPGWDIQTTAVVWTDDSHQEVKYYDYGEPSGTSFASPIVAGTVALMLSVNPELTYGEVESILKVSADKSVFDTDLHPENAPFVNVSGAGRLDAYKAVQMAQGYESYEVSWTNIDDVAILDDDVVKTSGSNWWNAGASSLNMIPASETGWVQIKPESTSGSRMFGLSDTDQGSTWNSIDYNFYLDGANLKVYHTGSYRGSFGTYKAGDVLKVTIRPHGFLKNYKVVTYSKNGEELYSVLVYTTASSFVADLSLYTLGSSLDNFSMSHHSQRISLEGQAVNWTNLTGVSVNSRTNVLTKTNQTYWWNSGAASAQKISSDHSGWVSVDAISTSHHRMIGLSPVDQGASWNTIKYNLYLSAGGEVYLYSYGTKIKDLGKFVPGDKFIIARKQIDGTGYIMFFKNDILQYGWEVVMNEDLIVDACLYTPDGQLNNVRIEDEGIQEGIIAPDDGQMAYNEPLGEPLGASTYDGFTVDISNDSITSAKAFAEKFDPRQKVKHAFTIDPSVLEPIFTDSIRYFQDLNVIVYPNPVSDFLYVQNDQNEDLNFSVHHLISGQVLWSSVIPASDKGEIQTINLASLKPGAYLLKINSSRVSSDYRIIKK